MAGWHNGNKGWFENVNIKLKKKKTTFSINFYESLIFPRNTPLMIQAKLFKMSDVGGGDILKLEYGGGGIKNHLINPCQGQLNEFMISPVS